MLDKRRPLRRRSHSPSRARRSVPRWVPLVRLATKSPAASSFFTTCSPIPQRLVLPSWNRLPMNGRKRSTQSNVATMARRWGIRYEAFL